MKNYFFGLIAVVALVLSLVGLVGGNQSGNVLGGRTNYDTVQVSGLVVGSSASATNLSLVKTGTCSLIAVSSIAATSTGYAYCTGLTGVQSGDIVDITLTASTSLASQYVVKGVSASSTAGAIDVSLLNLTGAAATPAATNGFGSSTEYKVYRTQTSDQGL